MEDSSTSRSTVSLLHIHKNVRVRLPDEGKIEPAAAAPTLVLSEGKQARGRSDGVIFPWENKDEGK